MEVGAYIRHELKLVGNPKLIDYTSKMSIQELEQEIRQLSRSDQDRLAAFLTFLRIDEESDESDSEEFVKWSTVREKLTAS
ncbi:MAG: hypothetical protein CMO55_24470 [Verrucomicrobiales bacterium]|nr:hypothetical protein [Verrucomicrobiales bacterium]